MTVPAGLLAAKLEVQKLAPVLKKSAENPHYRSRFAPLDEIVETMNPILSAVGLVWTALPSFSDNGQPTLRYKLAHAPSGETEEGEMLLLLSKQDAQGQGSALTYARRYAFCSVLNLVADEDDDGARAAQARGQQQPQDAAPSKPQLAFLRRLITQNKLDAVTMDRLLADVEFKRGDGEKVNDALGRLTRAQCSGLIDVIQNGAIKTGESDVPAPLVGEFEHPHERPMEMGPA